MPELVRAAHVAHDFERAFVALVQVDQLLVRQPFLGEVPQRFQTQFQCLVGDHDAPLFSATRTLLFANFAGQFRQELQDVVDDSHIRHLENRGLRILVDGDDERIALDAGQMLERAADAACQVDLGLARSARTSPPGATSPATWRRPPAASNSPPRPGPRPVPRRSRRCLVPECRGRSKPAPAAW